jgi:dihydropteroate synthase
MNCVDMSKIELEQETKGSCAAAKLRLTRPAALMAIVNVTPDSFSDGSQRVDPDQVLDYARSLADTGVRFLDIGGESTRPGASPVAADEECRRVLPAIERICGESSMPMPMVSIDTSKAVVAAAALQAGAALVNDISAGADPEMFTVVAKAGVPMVLMHMQGTPQTMQTQPRYDDVIDDICIFLEQRMRAAVAAGIDEALIIVDPGIGFGKTTAQNLSILSHLSVFRQRLGRPLLVGLSRKSFLPKVMGRDLPAAERDRWSHLFHAQIADQCEILRVHDVVGARDACTASRMLGGSVDV